MTIKHLSTSALILATALTVAGCQEYDPFSMEEVTKAAYSKNFFKQYGEFPQNMNWDLSSVPREGKIDASIFSHFGYSVAGTRAESDHYLDGSKGTPTDIATYKNGSSDYYLLEEKTFTWLRDNLQEGRKNTDKGNPFSLDYHGAFAIIPVFQGNASMVWDLHLVHNGVDYNLWRKNTGLELRPTVDKRTWNQIFTSGTWSIKSDVGSIQHSTDNGVNYDNVTINSSANWLYDIKLKMGKPNYQVQLPDHKLYINSQVTTVDASFYIEGDSGDKYRDYGATELNLPCEYTLVDDETIPSVGANTKGTFTFKGDIKGFPYVATNKAYPSQNTDGTWDNVTYDIVSLSREEMILSLSDGSDVWKFVFQHNDKYLDWEQVGSDNKATTESADFEIRSHPIIIDKVLNEGDNFYLYLEIVTGGLPYTKKEGTHQRSTEGMMLALTCPKPDNLDTYKDLFGFTGSGNIEQVMVIGCEDSDMPGGSDWDINDVVFLCVGLDKLPTLTDAKAKRYLIEDLGNTHDFDFNDIVVDVSELYEKNLKYNSVTEKYEWEEVKVLSQKANIKHLCGTLPFKVYFAETSKAKEYSFNRMQGIIMELDQTAEGPQYEHSVELTSSNENAFWDPDNDNIRIDVLTEGGDWSDASKIYTIDFQKATPLNKAPLMIAVSQAVGWTSEGVQIPGNWFFYDFDPNDLSVEVGGNRTDSFKSLNGDFSNNAGITVKNFAQTNNYQDLNITFKPKKMVKLVPGTYEFSFDFTSTMRFNEFGIKFGDGIEPKIYNLEAGTTRQTLSFTFSENNTKTPFAFTLYINDTSSDGNFTLKNFELRKTN